MKIRRFFPVLAALALLPLFGCSTTDQSKDWNALQAGIWFGYPGASYYGKVAGLKIGLPISSGVNWVDGVEMSLFGSTTHEVNGVQAALGWNDCDQVKGIQSAIFYNGARGGSRVFQFGLVNFAEYGSVQLGLLNLGTSLPLQIGVINFNSQGFIPVMILFNYAPNAW